MRTRIAIALLLVFLSTAIRGQGIVVYDQQSSVEGIYGEGGGIIQLDQPIGQSFTPSLSSVGFVQFYIVGSSGMVYVNLRANSMTGTVLGQSEAISMHGPFGAPLNFVFGTPISVMPGVTYYFQLVANNTSFSVSGDLGGGYYSYPGGEAFIRGNAVPREDLWFREGIYVVPEPSPVWLLLVGSMVFGFRAHCRRARTVSER